MGKSDLSKRKMSKVVVQTAEKVSTSKANKILVKILDSNYDAKAYLKHVSDNTTHLNSE